MGRDGEEQRPGQGHGDEGGAGDGQDVGEDEAPVPREPAADQRGPAVPDWADDEHLDAAFAQWKPGPAADASAVEHEMVEETDDPAPPLADDLAAALSEALVATSAPADTSDEKPRSDFSEEPRSDFSKEPRSD